MCSIKFFLLRANYFWYECNCTTKKFIAKYSAVDKKFKFQVEDHLCYSSQIKNVTLDQTFQTSPNLETVEEKLWFSLSLFHTQIYHSVRNHCNQSTSFTD